MTSASLNSGNAVMSVPVLAKSTWNKVVLLEPVGFPDADAFPYEFGFQQGGTGAG